MQTPGSYRYYRIDITKVNRKDVTVVTPAVGKKGKKGYQPATTTTTKTDNRAGFSAIQMSYGVGIPRVVNGYTIYLGRKSKGKATKDHAPITWYFEGWDGDKWQLLDSRQNYEELGSVSIRVFCLAKCRTIRKYRIRIKEVFEEGDVNPRIGKLAMSSPDAPTVVLRATSRLGINDGRGFLITDVGRQIRIQDADNTWRWGTITAVTNETDVTITIAGNDPLVLNEQIKFWRLGAVVGHHRLAKLWCFT